RDRNVTGVQTCALPIFTTGSQEPGAALQLAEQHVPQRISRDVHCHGGAVQSVGPHRGSRGEPCSTLAPRPHIAERCAVADIHLPEKLGGLLRIVRGERGSLDRLGSFGRHHGSWRYEEAVTGRLL